MAMKWVFCLTFLGACAAKPSAVSESDALVYAPVQSRVVYRNDITALPSEPHQTRGFSTALNGLRVRHGLSPLRENPRLTAIAFQYAHEIKYHSRLSHIGPDGSTPAIRANRGGYNWRFIGENLASGYNDPNRLLAAWMRSAGHRKNLLERRVQQFGIARVQDTWVLIVAQPKAVSASRPGVTYGQPVVTGVLPPR